MPKVHQVVKAGGTAPLVGSTITINGRKGVVTSSERVPSWETESGWTEINFTVEFTEPVVIPSYLSDDQAERIGRAIATDFGLSKSPEHSGRWITLSGTFTNKGLARRAHRLIVEGL